MKTIDIHERLKRSLAANLVLCDQVDEQEKLIEEKVALNFSLCEFLEKTEEAVIDLVIVLGRARNGINGGDCALNSYQMVIRDEIDAVIDKHRSKQ